MILPDDDTEILQNPRLQALQNRLKDAGDEAERVQIVRAILGEMRRGSKSIVEKLEDGIEVRNLDEVQAAFHNEFLKHTKAIVGMLREIKIGADEHARILEILNAENRKEFDDSFEIIRIKKPQQRVVIDNLTDLCLPKQIGVNNLSDLAGYFDKLGEILKALKLSVNIPEPRVTVNPPVVNVPETRVEIPAIDLSPIVRELERSLNKIRTNDKSRPLAVRLTDGQDWIKEFKAVMDKAREAFAAFPGAIRIQNADGSMATVDSGASPSTVGTGTKTITTAGTAVQLIAASTPCRYAIISADLGNTNPVVVGDANVVAANGSQRGIVLIPGNDPVRIEIDNVNKLYADSQTNGDEVCFAYFN